MHDNSGIKTQRGELELCYYKVLEVYIKFIMSL